MLLYFIVFLIGIPLTAISVVATIVILKSGLEAVKSKHKDDNQLR